MKVLTVQQPFAWAIFHGKNIENRTQMWKYRGPVAIHAGARISDRGMQTPAIRHAWAERPTKIARNNRDWSERHGTWVDVPDRDLLPLGAVLGVVDLVDAHPATRVGGTSEWCCEPWGVHLYGEKGSIVHLVLENPREFKTPIPNVKGRLGLWTPDTDLLDAINAAA